MDAYHLGEDAPGSAMSSSETEQFDERELLEFAQRLAQQYESLQDQIEAATQSAAIVDLDAPIGRLTRMDALQRQQMAAAALRRQRRRLAQTRDALVRVKDPDLFGYCAKCDEWIGTKRLSVRPETPVCIVCQSQGER
ncbi:MAG TPA: hypothetical protein DCQ06_07620 [Myxococcales bacterium]|nr:hypothetical protein [Myxococcales bacterium]